MRISDWSSDVCSSDLREVDDEPRLPRPRQLDRGPADGLHALRRPGGALCPGVPGRRHPRERRRRRALTRPVTLHRLPELRARLPVGRAEVRRRGAARSEEHTSELQSLMRISYAVFCLKKKTMSNL